MNDTDIHLIAMPWGPPQAPSMALGSLTSYIRSRRKIEVKSYNAFLVIPVLCASDNFDDFYQKLSSIGENIFLLLYLRRYRSDLLSSKKMDQLISLIQKKEPWFNKDVLNTIENVTIDYLENEVISKIDIQKKNIVGFSLGHTQTYASLFAYEHLRQKLDDTQCLFIFGGHSMSYDQTRFVLKHFEVNALGVIGEGEETFVWLIDYVNKHGTNLIHTAQDALAKQLGIINFADQMIFPMSEMLRTNFDLSQLATPDYSSFFNDIDDLTSDDDIKKHLLSEYLVMHIEGSRGCAFRCGFCNYGINMKTHRYHSGEKIYKMAKELHTTYGVRRIHFTDSQADNWANEYCKRMRAGKIVIASIMSIRTKHDFSFYQSLKDSGVEALIFGIDALTDHLLEVINKKTTVFDNIKSLKYVKEVGISSMSNIITHYPGATLDDVYETRRLLSLIPHLGRIGFHIFRLGEGSIEHKKIVKVINERLPALNYFEFPPDLVPLIVGPYCEIPEQFQIPSAQQAAWDELVEWYQEYCNTKTFEESTLTIDETADETIITDKRNGRIATYSLRGTQRRVLHFTHSVRTRIELQELVSESPAMIDSAISKLIEKDLLISNNKSILNICTRKRGEQEQERL